MNYQEACAILEVPLTAGADEIKKAYRHKAREFHPDHNPSDSAAETFLKIQAAYDLLVSTEDAVPTIPSTSGEEADSSSWMLGRKEKLVRTEGLSVTGILHVSGMEVLNGTVEEITFQDVQPCERCGATGAEPQSAWIPCPPCETMPRRDCPWCAGEQQIPELVCGACKGASAFPQPQTVRVRVPRSVSDGQELRLPGRGCWGPQGRGDLLLTVKTDLPLGFQRSGDDLEIELGIDYITACLGGIAEVEGLDGQTFRIAIKPGSSSGKRYRLRGQGLYRHDQGDERGDLFAVVRVTVPSAEETGPEEIRLLNLLAEARQLIQIPE